MTRNTPTILLVEDNPAHAELVRRSFQQSYAESRITHVSDGQLAIDYLFRRGTYADPQTSPRPSVILLDLRLPKKNGLEVLEMIKADTKLRCIPIVILTTSEAEKDLTYAYEQHANSYLVKPVSFDRFRELMHNLGRYWLEQNRTLCQLSDPTDERAESGTQV